MKIELTFGGSVAVIESVFGAWVTVSVDRNTCLDVAAVRELQASLEVAARRLAEIELRPLNRKFSLSEDFVLASGDSEANETPAGLPSVGDNFSR